MKQRKLTNSAYHSKRQRRREGRVPNTLHSIAHVNCRFPPRGELSFERVRNAAGV